MMPSRDDAVKLLRSDVGGTLAVDGSIFGATSSCVEANRLEVKNIESAIES